MYDDEIWTVPHLVSLLKEENSKTEGEDTTFRNYDLSDTDVCELVEFLVANPNKIDYLNLSKNRLTDETGKKLAQFVASSKSIEMLILDHNQFGEATYLAMAEALRSNTSLRILSLNDNTVSKSEKIEEVFLDAIQINPIRPRGSRWYLFQNESGEYRQLKNKATVA